MTFQSRILPGMLLLFASSATFIKANPQQPQTSAPSQQPPAAYKSETVLRATTRLVVVDVVVVGNNGKPLVGLHPADFTVLEDGVAQKISGFSFHHVDPAAQTQVPIQLPPDVVTNAPRYRASSLNVVLLDTLNGDLSEYAYARDQLMKFFEGGPLSQPVAVYVLGQKLTLLHDFTTDNKELRTVVASYKPPAHANPQSSVYASAALMVKDAYHTDDRSIETTLAGLNSLAQVLAGYPGRKNLIWLSEAFPLDLFPAIYQQGIANGSGAPSAQTGIGRASSDAFGSQFRDYGPELEKAANALMNAQVAVYPIDPAGLAKEQHGSSLHAMNSMAERTGGRASYNRNDVGEAVRSSIDDGSNYYTLEYYPANKKWDGKFRVIALKTSVPGTKLRYRQGYYALDPEGSADDDSKKLAENFSRAMELDSPVATGVLFQAQVAPPKDRNKGKVVVTFHIDPHTVSFSNRNDMQYAKISCAVWAYPEKGKVIVTDAHSSDAAVKPDVYEQIMKQYYPCQHSIDLKPGVYKLRLGVVDRVTNLMGTANSSITVP